MIALQEDAPRRVTVTGAQTNLLEQQHPTSMRKGVKLLPSTFNSGGFWFRQLCRKGNVALFEKSKGDNNRSFEVVRIQRREERFAFGKVLPASEVMPSAERWGKDGWTYADLEQAREKFRALAGTREGVALGTPKPVNRISLSETGEASARLEEGRGL